MEMSDAKNMPAQGTVLFSHEDLREFSRLSHDVNPLHMDDAYARRTPYGQRVVFGVLGGLSCLAAMPRRSGGKWERLEMEFQNPMFAGVEYSLRFSRTDDATIGELCDGRRVLVRVKAWERRAQPSDPDGDGYITYRGDGETFLAATPKPQVPREYGEAELARGLAWQGCYKARPAAEPAAATPSWRLVDPTYAEALMLCSYLVGMEAPGRRALFSRLDLRFPPTESAGGMALEYLADTRHFDPGYGLLTLNLRILRDATALAHGELKAFVRKELAPPSLEPLQAMLAGHVAPPLAGKVALVTGGSRGLGACLAQALAWSGCRVAVNFLGSRSDAEALAASLARAPGEILLLQGDAGDIGFCREAKARVLERFGRLDLLVCNACGAPQPMEIGESAFARIQGYLSGNLALGLAPASAFLDELSRTRGVLALVSSAFVESEPKEFPHYLALKLALEGLVRGMAKTRKDIAFLVARPPRLLTEMNNTPVGALGALPPMQAALAIVEALMAPPAPGEVRILDAFPSAAGAPAAPSNSAVTQAVVSPAGGEAPPSVPKAPPSVPKARIVVAATFTADPVLAGLRYWIKEFGWDLEAEMAPYNQVFQELLDPGRAFSANRGGLNLILLRVEDWLAESHDGDAGAGSAAQDRSRPHLEKTVADFLSALGKCAERSRSRLLIILCPPSGRTGGPVPAPAFLAGLEEKLIAGIRRLPGAEALRAKDFHALYRVEGYLDPVREDMGHIPYVPAYYHVLATLAARRWHAAASRPYKVIVVDCDNTLWEGVCEEAGPAGVKVEGGYLAFQEFLVDQQEKGMLLCLCSKNREDAVWNVFRSRPDMPLRREHIVDGRINWTAKSENLKSLARALNLGLDAFIFIDDNPVECAEVSAACPQVLVLPFPAGGTAMDAFLGHNWCFDRSGITEEDRSRTQMYQQDIARNGFRSASGDFADFIKGLDLRVRVEPLTPARLGRFSQLTLRTNQFNFTTVRRSEQDIRNLEGATCLTVEVADRFGEYGMVGAVIAREREGRLFLDTFLLSCRVLGRGVEHRVIAEVGALARSMGLESVDIPFQPSGKNEPARLFLDEIAAGFPQRRDGAVILATLPAEALCAVAFRPEASAPEAEDGGPVEAPAADRGLPPAQAAAWKRINGRLCSMEGLGAELGAEARAPAAAPSSARVTPELPVDRARGQGDPERAALALVARAFAGPLSMRPEDLDPDTELETLLAESFKIVEITVELKKAVPGVPQTLLFERRSPRDVAAYLLEHHRDAVLGQVGAGPSAEPDGGTAAAENALPPTAQPSGISPGPVTGPHATVPARPPARSSRPQDIAIIGISGRFPGAGNLEEFWDNLREGRSGITEVPADRWLREAFHDATGESPDKAYCQRGAFLDRIKRFDADFFGISPREAMYMDPQQRMFLESAWAAMEDAGYTRASLDRNTGVFVGVLSCDYGVYASEAALHGLAAYRWSDYYQIANRVSYHLDLHGPSLAVDSACSSSATALHLACESLKRGESGMAIVGGVNVILHPARFVQYAQMQMMARDGLCKPFGADATGTVFGEGVGALLLKPLAAAERDGDPIHAVIRGTAINTSGKTNGFTVPNPQAHCDLIRKALAEADAEAASLDYIEAHGTGTPLGDPIEVRGLAMAFAADAAARGRASELGACALGSLKGNIGHLESCAAIAGIIKIILQFRHGVLAPSLHSATANPMIPFADSPFRLQTSAGVWERRGGPRRAGLSSFGAGGANAHVILEEYPQPHSSSRPTSAGARYLFPFSAKTPTALRGRVERMRDFLAASGPDLDPAEVAYTLQAGREHFGHRAAFTADSAAELRERMDAFLAGRAGEGIHSGAGSPAGLAEAVPEGDLDATARAWASGAKADWGGIRPTGRRIAGLPAYPFEGLDHWLPENVMRRLPASASAAALASASPAPSAAGAALPPAHRGFLGQEVSSPFLEGSLRLGGFGLERQPYLDDHRIYGRVVVPGSFYVAYALTAAGGPQPSTVRICNVTFVKAITLDAEESLAAQFLTRPASEGRSAMEMATRAVSGEDPWQTRFTAEWEPCGEIQGRLFSLESLRFRCGQKLDPAEFYRNSRDIGFGWGPRFQCIRKLQRGAGEALAEVTLPESLVPDMDGMAIHPAFLDACFQVFVAALEQDGGREAFLPLGIDTVILYRKPALTLWAYVRFGPAPGPDTRVFDIALLDASGEVHAEFQGMRVLRARRETLSSKAANARAEWLYDCAWLEQPLHAEAAPGPRGRWLVASDNGGLARGLADEIAAAGASAEVVAAGEASMGAAIAAALAAGPAEGVLYLADPPSGGPAVPGLAGIEAALRRCTEDLLGILAAAAGRTSPPRIWLITRNAQVIENGAEAESLMAAAWGIGKAALWEHPELWGGMADLPAEPGRGHLAALVREVTADAGEDCVAIRSRRYVSRLAKVSFPSWGGDVALPSGASYLVTGAFGGLGPQLSEWLAEKGARSLVLLGRRPPKDAALAGIERLRSRGVEVHVRLADVSDPAQVKTILAESGRSWPALKGILHAAGSLDDGLLLNQNWGRFRTAWAAKAAGAWNLHEGTRGLPLDFFILFSSASAVLGAAGQANYAFANAFLDALAGYRRGMGLPCLSVNWGPWSGAGMAARLGAQGAKGWTTEAFGSIRPADGLQILGSCLSIPAGRLSVLPYRWEEMAASLGARKAPSLLRGVMTLAHPKAAKAEAAADDLVAAWESEGAAGRRASLARFLAGQVAGLLGHPEGTALDPQTPFQEMGFDSLMALELRNRIGRALGRNLPATLVFDHPNLRQVGEYLAAEVLGWAPPGREASAAAAAGSGESHATPQDGAAEEMSEAEVNALLEAELSKVKELMK